MKQKSSTLIDNYLYIIALYFILFLILRVSIGNALERDEAEQFLLNSVLNFGYSTQPPLYTWIQSIFFKLFNDPILALSILKNLLLFGIYLLTYKITLYLSKNKSIAAIATSSLLLIPSFSWEYQRDLTHSVLVTFFSMLLLFLIINLRDKGTKTIDYIQLGIVSSLGILSKYNFSLLILTIFILSFFDTKTKEVIFNKKIFIALFVSIAILSPHLYWIFNHLNTATTGTLNKMQISDNFNILKSLKVLFMALLELLAPYLILFAIFFKKDIKISKTNFFKKYFFILIILLVSIVVLLKMQYFKSRWIAPMFLPITIFMATSLKTLNNKKINYWLAFSIFIMLGFLTAFSLRYTKPDLFKHPSRFNYPAKEISNYLNKLSNFKTVLYGSNLVGANLKLYKPNTKYIYLNKKSLKKYKNSKETLIILDKDSNYQIPLLRKNHIKLKELKFNYKNSKKVYKIYIGVI